MSDDFKFVLDGKTVSLKNARKASVLVISTEDKVAQLFYSQSAFRLWAEKSEHAEKLAQMDELVRRAKRYKNADNTAAIKRQQTTTKRITKELKELARTTGLPFNSEELFLRATSDCHPLEAPVFDPAILFEHINRSGRALPLVSGVPYADLRLFGFNDIASSLISNGACALWADIWFTGRWILLLPLS